MSEIKIGDRVLLEVEVTHDDGDYGGLHVQLPHRVRDPTYNSEQEDWYVLPHEVQSSEQKVIE